MARERKDRGLCCGRDEDTLDGLYDGQNLQCYDYRLRKATNGAGGAKEGARDRYRYCGRRTPFENSAKQERAGNQGAKHSEKDHSVRNADTE